MALNGDKFGCCGRWYYSCAAGKGCTFHDPYEALNNCSVYRKLYIDRDEVFTKRWMDQLDENGNVKPHEYNRIPVPQYLRTIKPTKSPKDEILDKLSDQDPAAVAAILALLDL